MNKILYLIILCLYVLGTIGGIGYTAYSKAYVITVGIIALGWMAFPTAREYFKKLIS